MISKSRQGRVPTRVSNDPGKKYFYHITIGRTMVEQLTEQFGRTTMAEVFGKTIDRTIYTISQLAELSCNPF